MAPLAGLVILRVEVCGPDELDRPGVVGGPGPSFTSRPVASRRVIPLRADAMGAGATRLRRSWLDSESSHGSAAATPGSRAVTPVSTRSCPRSLSAVQAAEREVVDEDALVTGDEGAPRLEVTPVLSGEVTARGELARSFVAPHSGGDAVLATSWESSVFVRHFPESAPREASL